MSQSARQRNLFAAEDFSVIYDTFSQSNFYSYDYDTIRNAMVEYIRNNYPENFNDWIRSSEFVSLIELMAFLGHNLAFRTDLAVRENFLSTAERRQSVLKIAEFLGYSPARSFPASGFLKIKSVRTTQNVYDINGNSLKNNSIDFLDDNSSSNYQNFILVMNEIFSQSNLFGNPYNTSIAGGVKNDIYKLNNIPSENVVFPFKANVNGVQQNFEIYNPDIQDGKIIEKSPNPFDSFNIIYKNDNQGLGSENTGFFFGFKQGTINSSDFVADNPVSNLTLDILQSNINDIDVWVQEISSQGLVKSNWKKIDKINGLSNIFSPDNSTRKLFSVTTLENDSISINFGDGEFAEIPRGNIRIWYRTGINQTYVLNPDDVNTVSININYLGSDNNEYTATFTAALEEPVTNAARRESLENIKQKAGRVFSTQDRMVTAEDYTIYPVSVSSNILKIKSINRTHSGHSKYDDFNDPTGNYKNVNIFSKDGYIYTENILKRKIVTITENMSNTQLFDTYISDIINDDDMLNFYYKNYDPVEKTPNEENNVYEWQQVTTEPNSSSGYFTITQTNVTSIARVADSSEYSLLRYIKPNAIVEFVDSNGQNPIWATIVSVYRDGVGLNDSFGLPTGLDNKNKGTIVLNKLVPDGYQVNRVFPKFSTKFSNTEKQSIISKLFDKNTFGIRYDSNEGWDIIEPEDLSDIQPNSSDTFSLDNAGNKENLNKDESWLIRFEYYPNRWIILTRNYRIIFGSENSVRFYDQDNQIRLNSDTNKADRDKISIIDKNSEETIDLFSSGEFIENNGNTNDRKLLLSLRDMNNNGFPDNPVRLRDFLEGSQIPIGKTTDNEGNELTVLDTTSNQYYTGKHKLYFYWEKISRTNVVVDPSISNIIDTFVITSGYDRLFRNWLVYDRDINTKPYPPTSLELSQQFSNISDKKSISDTVIYRSGKYRILFGNLADPYYQARFRVIKVKGTSLNDGEIKSRVVENIQRFFNINNWEFGETFYFTELAAYIHKEMRGVISSIVIVPIQETSVFGNLFELTPESDELFIPDVGLDNIDILSNFTEQNLRIEGT